jgi:CheY-like chemotaxis protein
MSPRKLLRIFVVDDEYVIASTTALILRHCGFDASFFTAPLEALKAAIAEPPDLLLSDVVMPQLTGVELAMQLRAHCPSCKVLLFSGQANTANMLANALAEGHVFDLLPKPIHPDALLRKIEFLVGHNPSSPAHADPPTGVQLDGPR